MSQLENCIRGLHRRSVALNLTNRQCKKNRSFEKERFRYDSDWARTSDLYPVKVALSQLSYRIMLCCYWVYFYYSSISKGVKPF